jgi:hypothetical protein
MAFSIFLMLIICGCRTAPDMRPFADATSQLSSSIKTTGRTVVSEVDSMSAQWGPAQLKSAKEKTEKFEQQWAGRQNLGAALVDYSVSLTAIVEAGEQGEKSAKAVDASFKKLTDAVGIAFPQAAAAGVAVDVGAHLYGMFAKDHAAKTLGEGMQRLQPAIDETATILKSSFKAVEDGLDAVRDQIAQNVEDEMVGDDKVTTKRNRLKILMNRRANLLIFLNNGTTNRDSLRGELIITNDAKKELELDRLTKLMTDITAELVAVEGAIALESESLKPIDARKAADHERLTTAINLVRTARDGLDDWAAAHARLAAAALEKKPPQVEDLIQTANEVRELVKIVRAGQNH